MKVKALKVMAPMTLNYITEGKEYNVIREHEVPFKHLVDIIDDQGDSITIVVSDTQVCAHMVDWEVVQ